MLCSNHAAHHIVMTGTQNTKMNSLVTQMQAHGINIDGDTNGIWIPVKDVDKEPLGADISHQQDGLHGNDYKDEIYDRLNGKNKADFETELANIKQELEAGRTWETGTTKKLGKACR
nr:AHH domain-containing protein [Flavobacterium sp. F-65]